MNKEIQTIERILLNAMPARQTVFVGDWIVRLNKGYTYRGNCICPFQYFESARNETNLTYCESIFAANHLPCVVRYTPTTQNGFDRILKERGYRLVKTVDVMVCAIEEYEVPDYIAGEQEASEEWIKASASLSGVADAFFQVHKEGVQNIAVTKTFVYARIDGAIVGCGYGVVEKGYVGIYNLHVSKEYRKQGIGTAICNAILTFGKENGAAKGYLFVHNENENAISLYEKKGFRKLYEYQFYQKDREGCEIIDG